MAGIGFSLRATAFNGGYLARARSLGAAGVVSSGPWLLATLGLLVVRRAGSTSSAGDGRFDQFHVCVTWILAGSLVWTSPLQLMFTRFVADRDYLRERDRILPNVLGALALTSAGSAVLACGLSVLFRGETIALRVLLGTAFVCACDVWMVVLLLASLRQHGAVLACFGAGYATTAVACALWAQRGVEGLLAGFALGQASLLFSGLIVIARCLPRSVRGDGIELGFLRRGAMFPELGVAGLAFNLGCVADELVFWLDPGTSRPVVGVLRASSMYDLPSFAASACLIPGTTVFLVHVETELAERQRAFFDAVLAGATLQQLQGLADLLAVAARSGIAALLRTQAATWLACVTFGSAYLRWLSGEGAASLDLHLPLLHLTALAVALQMLVSAVLSMLFYLDRRRSALALCLLLCASNAGLSWLTLRCGPAYYGCGHAVAMGVTCVWGLSLLNRAVANLVRDTFMLQPGTSQ
jgi:uncharacterized membrane protein